MSVYDDSDDNDYVRCVVLGRDGDGGLGAWECAIGKGFRASTTFMRCTHRRANML